MKNLKKLITLFLLVSILLSFAGCGNLFSRDGLSWDGSYYQLTDKDGVVVRIPLGVSLSELSKKKGNAGEKSFWDSIFGLKLQAPAAMAPMTAPLGLSKGGAVARGSAVSKSGAMTRLDAEGDVVIEGGFDVLSAKAKFSLGTGEVKHPITGEVLCEPNGTPFIAGDKQVLVLQHTDQYHRALDFGSPDAYYLVMVIINYMGKPGEPDDTGIQMAAQADFLVKDTASLMEIDGKFYPAPTTNVLVNYMEWRQQEWSENWTKLTENFKSIGSGTDNFGIRHFGFGITERVRYDRKLDESGVWVQTSTDVWYGCDSNWNVISESKTTTIDKYRSDGMLGSITTLLDEGNDGKDITKEINYYAGNSQLFHSYKVECYYPNGQLKSSTEDLGNGGARYINYYENGQLEDKSEILGNKETGERYFENGQLEYRWEYEYTITGNLWVPTTEISTRYDRNGNVVNASDGTYVIDYSYDENGNLIAWEKTDKYFCLVDSYYSDDYVWLERTYYSDGSLKSEVTYSIDRFKSIEYYNENRERIRWEKYYPNGQLNGWRDYVADKSEEYYENGQLRRRSEGGYEITYDEDGRLISDGNKWYYYNDDGTYTIDVNGHVSLYDKDGNLLVQVTYQ